MVRMAVTKSSPLLVGPAIEPDQRTTPPAAGVRTIDVSSFDKPLAFSPFTSFAIFTQAIREPAETIRKALSRALVHYPPIAGRAVVGAGDEIRIACTGEGVEFVAARASCALADVGLFDQPFAALLRELAVDYAAGHCREADPLLLMQVTVFSCGGFVVGTTWNHVVADGTGIAQFLQGVGDLARGLPRPSVPPVCCGDTPPLPELPPLVTALEKGVVSQEHKDFVYLDITVPSSCIDRIKAEYRAGNPDDEACTVFEAVTAVLWQCRTRAVMSDDSGAADTPAPLIFAANVRKHVGAMDGYYSNCITSQVVAPTSRVVADSDINDVVRIIKRAKKQILAQFIAPAGEEKGDGGVSAEQLADGALFGYSSFYVLSWRNLGFGEADFGGGTPARVMCHVDPSSAPSCVACLPCATKDGASVLSRCVKEEHVDAFVAELAKFSSKF
ncbi:acyl transferase 15-like [Oryza brachyantha]|nr:acyl transferase 15-like [Oryza brachyantha]